MQAPNQPHNLSLQSALDALAFPCCIINTGNYRVEFANKSCETGIEGGATCYQLLHGSDHPCVDDGYPCPLQEIMRTGDAVVMEHRHQDKLGDQHYMEVHGFPIHAADGEIPYILELNFDITPRKKFEMALQESEANWRSLVETSPDHILILDADLFIQFANYASPGLKVEDLIGTPLYAYVDENRQEQVKSILQGVLDTGEPTQYETIYHIPDGGDIYYETRVTARRLSGTNQIVGLTLSARDITQRVHIHNERQALNHALGERVKELTCLYSISKLIMTPDITKDEILQGTADLIPPSWQYPDITCARLVLEGREFRTSNYQESPWTQTADIQVYGQPSGFVEVCYLSEKPEIDEGPFLKEERHLINAVAERLGRITERLHYEKRIHQNEIKMAAMEERERIGRELHDDLGQLIAFVSTQAQAARSRMDQGDESKVKAILDQLIQTTQDAHTDVRQYILGIREPSLSGIIQPGISNEPGFFAVLEDYLAVLQERYGLETQVSLPGEISESLLAPEVETQLLRIVQEALTNVSKHAGVDKARLLFIQHKDSLQVIVSDDGVGFDIAGLFSGSKQADRSRFGLKIIRERAESIDGRLEVRSSPGAGTSVIVHLPVTLSQTQADRGSGIRVLLVDDHPLYLEGLSSLLSSRGFQIVGIAHDGLQAQYLALELNPDLILMDVQMPGCDGLEATRRIKETLPETKIVMLTIAAQEETLIQALKNGASGYLLKSLDGRQFFDLLARVLDGEIILSPKLASMVLSEFKWNAANQDDKTDPLVDLTARQNEVLELTALGLSNKQIANKLHITEATVKYHVSQILERLHLKSRYQLARYRNQ